MAQRKNSKDINFANFSEKKMEENRVEQKKVIKKVQKNNSKTMNTTHSPMSVYRKIAITFVVLTIILALVVVYFSIVSVKVVIIPNKERTTASFTATVLDKASQQTAPGLSLTGVVEQAAVSVSQTFQTQGKEVKDTAVSGNVTLYNNRSSEQALVKTTRLLSPDGRLYRLNETVHVPAHGKVENVSVYADKSDASMEIEPAKFTIPGLNKASQELVYAESTEKFSYHEIGDAVVSEADLTQAQAVLKKELSDKAGKISQDTKYQFYDNVIANVSDEAVVYSTPAKAGDKIGEFSMSAEAKGAVVAFNTKDVAALAKLKIEENLPDDKQLDGFDANSFQFSVEGYDLNTGTADLKVNANAQMILKDGTNIIDPNRLIGLTRAQLDDYLSSLREVAGYEVKFTPNWINKVPSLVDHIKVEVAK
ncbi:hypothetical protein A2477_00475 [Candidatus Falkowbacteria bacterium RIFOXYC2_FULL_47_12]|uniref:Baseplate protein J-like domain-containing protein n=2 Tax=Candidatus Falkowiibacteriota TaxID=1752728 RepID=A0A1F5TLL0_9BACT|nr:MAG: hypothetical protein A2242_00185 [Candidatus Falkowbacteria bacterium RIFOXYA2_FULL_47_9]OGF39845.1 MAG: hypothetical protein A2477_00475 [Candidatus Falkowbacteria bacterium RIFOXYC2_FULL_47_12]